MDQDATWYGGRPRPRRYCVIWRPISPKNGGQQPPLLAHVLWPNGWMDQVVTWHGGWPRPRLNCLTWEPISFPKRGTAPQFSAHVCCGQTAGLIKMPLSTEVGLSARDIVLDGDPAPLKRCTAPTFRACLLWQDDWINQNATGYEGRRWPRRHCIRWGPSFPPPKRGTAPTFRPMSIVTKR